MRRLSGLDAAFLYTETPAMHMHGGAITVLDPSTAPEGLDVDRFREVIAARLDRLPPFRLKLAAPPLGVDDPVWVEAGDIDVRQHIRAVAVPRPGTPRQVADLAAPLLALTLPRDRPLWQMWFVEGLEDGRVALIAKLHHALLGGTQAAHLFELLYDLDPDAGGAGAPPERPASEQPPAGLAVAGHAAWALAGSPLRVGRAGVDLVRAAARLARFFASDQRAGAVLPFAAPMSSLNGSLVPGRSCAHCSLSLADVKAVRTALGVTVNDVVMAVCGGALRRYLEDRDELPQRSLTASVPVGVPGPGGDATSVLGNTTSVFGATLATDIADPLDRVRRINESTRAAKAMHAALGAELILHLADAVPPGLLGAAVRGYAATGLASRMPPPFNVVVSNLRGPATALYSGGARVDACHLFGPAIEAVSLDITVLTYRDSVDVGIITSPNLVPDAWPIAEAMAGALAELLTAAQARPSRIHPRGDGR